MHVRCAEVRPRPSITSESTALPSIIVSPPTENGPYVAAPTVRGCAAIACLWSGLCACDDHHGVGDYPAFGLRASPDTHGVAVARVHLVGTQPHPDAAVSPLVDLDLLRPEAVLIWKRVFKLLPLRKASGRRR